MRTFKLRRDEDQDWEYGSYHWDNPVSERNWFVCSYKLSQLIDIPAGAKTLWMSIYGEEPRGAAALDVLEVEKRTEPGFVLVDSARLEGLCLGLWQLLPQKCWVLFDYE